MCVLTVRSCVFTFAATSRKSSRGEIFRNHNESLLGSLVDPSWRPWLLSRRATACADLVLVLSLAGSGAATSMHGHAYLLPDGTCHVRRGGEGSNNAWIRCPGGRRGFDRTQRASRACSGRPSSAVPFLPSTLCHAVPPRPHAVGGGGFGSSPEHAPCHPGRYGRTHLQLEARSCRVEPRRAGHYLRCCYGCCADP